ncbi:hypothetical protein V1514DRAFT_331628 [Lipomyces japonicus]|uniref:mitochondrial 54S ribosomal protein mL53 n=1 Tax=Lipomyces japonicus TaxID=56871 RepID=UPI0034CEC2D2
MITKYFTEILVRLDPLSGGKTARVFLSLLPPRQRNQIKLRTEFISANQPNEPIIKVTYKDGKVVEVNPAKLSVADAVEEFDRQSRKLLLKERIEA